MRIHHEDCDVPMPNASDILSDFGRVSDKHREKFIPSDCEPLAAMWVRFVQISDSLGNILRAHYRVSGPRPNLETVEHLADLLQECAQVNHLPESSSDLLRLHAYQVELFYQ